MSRGRGRGRGDGTGPPPIDAATYRGLEPSYFYSSEHRQQVHAEILQSNPDLQRRVAEEEEVDEEWDARDELYMEANRRMRAAYDALSSAEKRPYEQQALENKHEQWRKFREQNRFIESEESLAQKADDEKKGITGPVGGRGRGGRGGRGGGGAPTMHQQQVTGTFIGGELLTPVQELTPPFNRNTLKLKTGKIEPEEYF